MVKLLSLLILRQKNMQADIFGKAIKDYYIHKKENAKIIVHSPDFDDDEIPVSYLFRGFNEMPKIEQIALQQAKGNILEVGCGAGSHALYLQSQNKNVTAIDISPLSIQIATKRGVKNAICADFFNFESSKPFETILILMNGIGIAGKTSKLYTFFEQAKKLLSPNGQILVDSSDLIYLFEDEDVSDRSKYYGEMTYQISYGDTKSEEFDWLYLDFEQLKLVAEMNGFKVNLIKKGSHFDYLAQLFLV